MTGDATPTVGNTRMGQGSVPPSHAESRAMMEGFLGVSPWFP
jgi:hypothetical protein